MAKRLFESRTELPKQMMVGDDADESKHRKSSHERYVKIPHGDWVTVNGNNKVIKNNGMTIIKTNRGSTSFNIVRISLNSLPIIDSLSSVSSSYRYYASVAQV